MRRAGYIALVAALALTGCGGSKHKKTIPRADAQALITELDQVSDNFDSQACGGARAKVGELETKANALPASVDQTVKQNTLDGLARLNDLLARDCQRAQTNTETNTTPTETQTTTTETTTTNTETNTTPTETNTTPTNTSTTPTTTTPGGTSVPGNGTGGTGTGASDGKKKDGK